MSGDDDTEGRGGGGGKSAVCAMVVTGLLRACQRVKDGAMRFIVIHCAQICNIL